MRSLPDMVHDDVREGSLPIDRMGAGELSEAVAREVMGWRRTDGGWLRPGQGGAAAALEGEAPTFASDIGQAVDLMGRNFVPGGHWGVRLDPSSRLYTVSLDVAGATHEASGSTLPIAACRALLKASREGGVARP